MRPRSPGAGRATSSTVRMRSHHHGQQPQWPLTTMPPQRGLWKALVLTGAPSLSWMYRGEWERSGMYSRKFSTG